MNRLKSILYKEWIKSRIPTINILIITLLMTLYNVTIFSKVVKSQGVSHLWGVMIERDVVFVEKLQWIPLVLGITIALAQFIPEMLQKRLKLTLHLPMRDKASTSYMLLYGFFVITGYLILSNAITLGYFSLYLPKELLYRTFITMVPWQLAAYAAYFLLAWVSLEENIPLKIISLLITMGTLRLFFLSNGPDGYPWYMLIILLVVTIFTAALPHYSIARFRRGYSR